MQKKVVWRSSKRRRLRKTGRGLLNSLIDKLPIELHIPGYNFCGKSVLHQLY